MAITAALVKELRDVTGVGMMDCKKALQECNGDIDAAVDWLRTKGLAKAAKKAGRLAAEGLIGLGVADGRGAVVEVNSETDFVARNAQFQDLVAKIVEVALPGNGDVEALAQTGFPGSGRSVGEELTAAIAQIGENMNLRRSAVLAVNEGVVSGYVHSPIVPGLGAIGVLVGLESSGDVGALSAFGKQVAMHVAATSPLAVSPDDLDPGVVAHERVIFSEQARESGKPEAIVEKMVEGRVRKFYEEVCLLAQTFVIDGETKVADALNAIEEDVGAPVRITGFVRFALGEGIEKGECDLAAEVAEAIGTK